jgi:hypothetical protein
MMRNSVEEATCCLPLLSLVVLRVKQFFISGCLPFSELIGWIFAAGFDDDVFGLG